MSLEVSIKKKLGNFLLEVDYLSDGGCVGVLGASGCGKSMTLKCIAGIITPDEGRIVLNGRVLFDSRSKIDIKPSERNIGYLFQNYALFPNMTVWQNIGCGLGMKRSERSDRDERISELIGQFGLDGLEKRLPRELSGGQQQRVALARMLARRPALVLLDEPFSALDAHLREQVQMMMLDVLRGFGDAVMVTHSRDEAYKLCSSLMVLDKGRSLVQGNTKEIFRQPRRVQAARLTGCKNISQIRKTGEREILALDWGVRLTTAQAVPEWASHVGIRAHDFIPADESSAQGSNTIPIKITKRLEAPFEWTIAFKSAQEDAVGEIWWKCGKHAANQMPTHLAFLPDSLLLLEGGDDE